MLIYALCVFTSVPGYTLVQGKICKNRHWEIVHHGELYRDYNPLRCSHYCNSAHACVGFAWKVADCKIYKECYDMVNTTRYVYWKKI